MKITGARFIAQTLHAYGVTHVFYMDSILRKALAEMEALGIRRILTHSEKAAAYMADGYARVSGRPGVCMAQSVGAANLAAGLQDAYLGFSPVIALTGKKLPLAQHRHAYQEIVHHPLYEPVTKYNVEVASLEQLAFQLRQAFREATTGAPRPVHLDLHGYNGRFIEDAEAELEVIAETAFTHAPAFRLEPDEGSIAAAAEAITGAERPVIVAGGGVRISGAEKAVRLLAEKRSIPVATSADGKATLPAGHRLAVGVVGTYSVECANRVVSEADLVIFIGCGAGDQVTNNWTIPRPGAAVVQIDIEPAELGRSYPGTVGVVGDARRAVSKLAAALAPDPGNPAWLDRVAARVDAWRAGARPLLGAGDVPIRPERLCAELSAVLPADAVLVADTGYSAIWTATLVDLPHPGQTYLRAAGSLGWAFPAALGVKCAVPDRPVVCFTGDGGFWYHLAEMETAARFGIATVTIVNNNSGLAQGIPDIRNVYKGREGRPGELFKFEAMNFARIAGEMGCLGIRVEQPDEIGPAVREALDAGRPAIVEVVTGLEHFAPAPWSPGN
ncbi:MAG TPA: thiamine pyrophosphate-binding protein [Anaerolineales bacterium]|nr:thiamine pyrophosphate-binding protein [Anaerolineales bacterium]